MNDLELLQSLMLLRGPEGVSLTDIYTISGKKDMEYAFFLLSTLEESLKDTPVKIKYSPSSKKYQIVIPNEIITVLEEKQVLKPVLSKASRATLACIIMNTIKEEPVTIALLKELRGTNVVNHLKELIETGYISQEDKHITLTDKLVSEIDIPALVKELEKTELELDKSF